MSNRYEPLDKIIIGSENTVFKKIESIKRFEVWDLCYTKKHMVSFPEKRMLDTHDGVIARFVIIEKDSLRTMTLLPERMIDGNDNDIAVLLGKSIDPAYPPPHERDFCEREANHFYAINDAMNEIKIYNPQEAFTNFFKMANINSSNFSGWFDRDGYCYREETQFDSYEVSDVEDRFIKVSFIRNYPTGWLDGEFTMTTWRNMPRRFILENPRQIDFYTEKEFKKPVLINVEKEIHFHNTGSLKKIDYRKLRLITKANKINDWADPKRNLYKYYSVYAGKHDYKNRPPAQIEINRSPNLTSISLDLPENSTLYIKNAPMLETVKNTTKLGTFRCNRRMRRMTRDRKLYSFLENLASLEKPLANNIEIEMGFFIYTGSWEGFLYYLPKFFKWLEDSRKGIKSKPINLLERGFFFEYDDY